MICTYCGTELPAGALFCGECGRAVTQAAKRVPRIQVPTVVPSTRQEQPAAPGSDLPESSDSGQPGNWHWGEPSGLVCENCGAMLSPDEIFCGECGAVSKTAARGFGQPRDTAIIQPVDVERLPPLPAQQPATLPEPVQLSEPVQPPAQNQPVQDQPVQQPQVERPAVRQPVAQRPLPSVDEIEDLEKTRIIVSGRRGERFVLQFSTGESSTVYGTGLIGRNPVPEPGEYFDQVVAVIDPSRSVSKTHLEFGQEGGAFWVMDRYSGNGTILREPDAQAVRCQPERRYVIARGTRVEIGEQFFIVS
ncbi:MAG: hypothetical protein JWN80_592 [Microbacteriaceae bacterium]|nr:hypothetical protein [Microbacteriaceae bacterium]